VIFESAGVHPARAGRPAHCAASFAGVHEKAVHQVVDRVPAVFSADPDPWCPSALASSLGACHDLVDRQVPQRLAERISTLMMLARPLAARAGRAPAAMTFRRCPRSATHPRFRLEMSSGTGGVPGAVDDSAAGQRRRRPSGLAGTGSGAGGSPAFWQLRRSRRPVASPPGTEHTAAPQAPRFGSGPLLPGMPRIAGRSQHRQPLATRENARLENIR